MTTYTLDTFLADCRACVARPSEDVDRVRTIAPFMLRLLENGPAVLHGRQLHADPAHYTRNLIAEDPSAEMSLYALVWLPGQWTPVHDHGTWGVVGVVEGVIEEQSYMCEAGAIRADSGIRLKPGGLVLLPPGAVTTFVPNPDHIHMTGVADDRPRAVSLHLYGRAMNSFHVYDVDAGTRRKIDVPHHKS